MKNKSLVEQVPLALFMGLIVGGAAAFFFIQMPMVLIEQAVIASGLPTIIAAAGPPLGSTARVLVAGSAALGSGGFTWLAITLVGMIGRPRRAKAVDEADDLPVWEPSYPEAPARRPIFAHADFGDPIAPHEISEEVAAPVLEPEPVSAPSAQVEPVEAGWEHTLRQAQAERVELEEEPLELVDVLPEEPQAVPLRRSSIAELLARLEAGAERRAARPAFAHVAPVTPLPAADLDGALRSALNELKRLAVR